MGRSPRYDNASSLAPVGRVEPYNPDPGHYYLYVEIGPPNADIFVVTLSQDPNTGLYEANTSQSVGAAFGCGKGAIVQVGGGTATELQTSQVPLSWTRR